jgi:Protein of unknown function (DUF1566)
MKKRYLQTLIACAWLCVAGLTMAQTSVLRDAAARERQQKDNAKQSAMQVEAASYVVMASGIVRDKTMSLEWMRCSIGQDWSEKKKTCEGSADKFSFEGAQDIARQLNNAGGYNGKRDWRVPTKDELASLVVCTNGRSSGRCADGSARPSIAQTIFPRTPDDGDRFWSSSPDVDYSNYAWTVNFSSGSVYNDGSRNNNYYVRLVR